MVEHTCIINPNAVEKVYEIFFSLHSVAYKRKRDAHSSVKVMIVLFKASETHLSTLKDRLSLSHKNKFLLFVKTLRFLK